MRVLSPLRATSAGHIVTIELQPADLGAVRATLVQSDGRLVVHLQADNPAARAAIQSGMADLRQDLGSNAHSSVEVFLAAPGGGPGGAPNGGHQGGAARDPGSDTGRAFSLGRSATRPEPAAASPVVAAASSSNRLLDVLA